MTKSKAQLGRVDVPLSEETKSKLSASAKTSPRAAAQRDRLHASNLGSNRSQETRQRISAGLKASAKAADQRERLRTDPAICAKRNAANTGQRRTEETRERMRASALARHARRREAQASATAANLQPAS